MVPVNATLRLVDPAPAAPAGPAVLFAGVSKRFGPAPVLDRVHLRLAAGRVTAVLGPNGAGKSTLIKCLLGLVRPDSGRIEVAGADPCGDPAARAIIGYAPQAPRFPAHSSGREILGTLAALRRTSIGRLDPIFGAFRLESAMDQPTGTLSGGTRQKLSVALALTFAPALLVLDEPTAGLDPSAVGVLKDRLRQERQHGITIVLASHHLADVEDFADDVAFLLDGRIRFHGPMRRLYALTGERRLERAAARLMASTEAVR